MTYLQLLNRVAEGLKPHQFLIGDGHGGPAWFSTALAAKMFISKMEESSPM